MERLDLSKGVTPQQYAEYMKTAKRPPTDNAVRRHNDSSLAINARRLEEIRTKKMSRATPLNSSENDSK